jgi:hypothetical protein
MFPFIRTIIRHLYYLLTPCSRVLLEKLIGLQLVKKYPAFMEPEGSLPHSQVTATCFYPEPAHTPNSTSKRSILILSSHLRLGLPSGLFHSGFSTQTLYKPLSSPVRATCPVHLILFGFITRTLVGEYRSWPTKVLKTLSP